MICQLSCLEDTVTQIVLLWFAGESEFLSSNGLKRYLRVFRVCCRQKCLVVVLIIIFIVNSSNNKKRCQASNCLLPCAASAPSVPHGLNFQHNSSSISYCCFINLKLNRLSLCINLSEDFLNYRSGFGVEKEPTVILIQTYIRTFQTVSLEGKNKFTKLFWVKFEMEKWNCCQKYW